MKAKVRANELTQERDALEQDKKELQEKYSEKTRCGGEGSHVLPYIFMCNVVIYWHVSIVRACLR
jgi:hypothetical protein